MTWIPLEPGEQPERDAVLGLLREPYEVVRETLAVTWQIAEPCLLDLCRLRLAQLMDAQAELAGADEELLADLERWESSATFTERERTVLAFAEQYHYDHNMLSDEQKAGLARELAAPGEVVNFVWALHMHDAYIRVLRLLDIAPDPPSSVPRPERGEAGDLGRRPNLRELDPDSQMAAGFKAVYSRLGPVAVRQTLVDDVTSEAIRLRNASHQRCLY
jgi:hypothetical protein